jgi:Kef-type K+ transport system membrane component KefB
VLGFAALLTLAAILGKLACAVVTPKGISGLTVGLGMMPRGEVGLIFAGIGAQLVLNGRPVIDGGTYAAAVFMVVATTMARTSPAVVAEAGRESLSSTRPGVTRHLCWRERLDARPAWGVACLGLRGGASRGEGLPT